MSDYREIRVRLNLRQQRDRWLASALAEAAEALGAPVASVVCRPLATYLCGIAPGRTTVASTPARGAVTMNQGTRERGAVNGRKTTQLPPSSSAKDSITALHDESDSTELMDRLASLGTPPGGATGGQ